jgi:hypothetical protein
VKCWFNHDAPCEVIEDCEDKRNAVVVYACPQGRYYNVTLTMRDAIMVDPEDFLELVRGSMRGHRDRERRERLH